MRLLLTILGSFMFYQLLAQSEGTYFQYLTISEGLPHNSVFCVLQDRHDFMWFGTQDGLVRYDGYECRVTRQVETDTLGFEGKSIHSLLEDKMGNLWVGTRSNGINLRDNKTGVFKTLKHNPLFKAIQTSWVKSIFQDKKGRIWIGTIGEGLVLYDPVKQSTKLFNNQNSRLQNNAISNISQDQNGLIWVGASGTGIYYFDEAKQDFEQIHSLESGDTDFSSFQKTFFNDGKGNIWVGTEGSGLYKIDLASKRCSRFNLSCGLTSNNIMGIAQNNRGQLLLATDGGGLNIFDPTTGKAVLTNRVSGTNTKALYQILIDKDNSVWIGTYNGGVNIQRTKKTGFATILPPTSTQTSTYGVSPTSNRSILGLSADAQGKLIVGTDGGGAKIFDVNKKEFIGSDASSSRGNVVKTIFEDSRQRIWTGYFNDGMSMFDKKTGKTQVFKTNPSDTQYISESISGNNIWSFAEDEKANIWVATIGGGLNCYNPEKNKFERFSHIPTNPNSISGNDVMVVFVDKSKQIWAGTSTQGLNLYNPQTGIFTHFKNNKKDNTSISANDIRSIYQDAQNRLWIGTESGGLNLWLGNGKFEHISTQNGLISDAIMGITEDKNGYLWVSAFKGLSRIDKRAKDFLTVMSSKNPRQNISNFDFHRTSSNHTSNQFNQSAIATDSNGVLYFGGINGLTYINPNEIDTNTRKYQCVFTDLRIFNKSVPTGAIENHPTILNTNLEQAKEIRLQYSDNAFTLEFAVLDFTDPFKSLYTYKMEGFDNEWLTTTGEQRQVTYTNLDPGTYTFRVKASNNNGVWSDEKSIRIIISPPFWKTWWFKVVFLFGAIASILWTLKSYAHKREQDLKQSRDEAMLRLYESEKINLSLTNDNLASEQAILQVQNEKMAMEIKLKGTELMSKAVQTAHKNEILIGIREQLELIQTSTDTEKIKLFRNLKFMLNTEIEGEKSWEQFTGYFDQVNQDFSQVLQKKHPSLTQNDLRMCALTRLNMSNKQIASLLNISVNGVEKSRYRLKKRLDLSIDDDLSIYLRNF
jgi:ligand-binding sensor domain-containing protein/DNA-binding CsgD family transcriptional regulator